jgi:hypothetical protein
MTKRRELVFPYLGPDAEGYLKITRHDTMYPCERAGEPACNAAFQGETSGSKRGNAATREKNKSVLPVSEWKWYYISSGLPQAKPFRKIDSRKIRWEKR